MLLLDISCSDNAIVIVMDSLCCILMHVSDFNLIISISVLPINCHFNTTLLTMKTCNRDQKSIYSSFQLSAVALVSSECGYKYVLFDYED